MLVPKALVVSFAVLALLGALAGCGDDEDDSSGDSAETSTASGAEAEFISDADAICAELNEKAASLEDAETLDQLAAVAEVAEEYAADGIAQLSELDPPTPELATHMDRFIKAVVRQTDVLSQVGDAAASAAVSGDSSEVDALVPKLERARDIKQEVAIEAGFSECGTG